MALYFHFLTLLIMLWIQDWEGKERKYPASSGTEFAFWLIIPSFAFSFLTTTLPPDSSHLISTGRKSDASRRNSDEKMRHPILSTRKTRKKPLTYWSDPSGRSLHYQHYQQSYSCTQHLRRLGFRAVEKLKSQRRQQLNCRILGTEATWNYWSHEFLSPLLLFGCLFLCLELQNPIKAVRQLKTFWTFFFPRQQQDLNENRFVEYVPWIMQLDYLRTESFPLFPSPSLRIRWRGISKFMMMIIIVEAHVCRCFPKRVYLCLRGLMETKAVLSTECHTLDSQHTFTVSWTTERGKVLHVESRLSVYRIRVTPTGYVCYRRLNVS